MYGEDIDLSYRIVLGSYKNYYFPKTRIIHYKGESTKKSSVNYVFVFYNAMIIFAKKHFSSKNARLFSFLINMAIYFRASIALMNRLVKKMIIPILDLAIITAGLFVVGFQYERALEINIPDPLLNTAIPVYAFVWFLTQIFSGGYDKPIKLIKNVIGGIVGTAIILMVYALLPKDVQFSRLIIVIGGAWILFYYIFSRLCLHFILPGYRIGGSKTKRFVIVGDLEEAERVSRLLYQTNSKIQSVEFVSTQETKENKKFVGTFNQLDQVIDIHKIDEVIFCAKNIASRDIISTMLNLEGSKVDFKIAQPETSFLIGSNSIDSNGDLYVMDINRINKPANQRNKRLIDVFVAGMMLILSPLLIWIYANKKKFYSNMFGVLTGRLSLVGYATVHHASNLKLPKIKRGILSSSQMFKNSQQDEDSISRLNLIYAKNHSLLLDLKIILNNLKRLDA